MKHFLILNSTVTIENLKENQGKVTIVNSNDTFEYTWNSMGTNSIEEFLLSTDREYFSKKFLTRKDFTVFDIKKTFENLKIYLREHLNFLNKNEYKNFYENHLCEIIDSYEEECEDVNHIKYFSDLFYHNFLIKPNFDLLIKNENDILKTKTILLEINKNLYDFVLTKESHKVLYLKEIYTNLKNLLQNG